MRADLPAHLFSLVWPTAALLLIFSFIFRGQFQSNGTRAFLVSAVCAIVIVSLPLGGISIGRWFAGLSANISLPLLALFADLIGRRVFQSDLLQSAGRRAAMSFGLVTGLALYPMALGLGDADPYVFGWSSGWLFGAMGVITPLLILRGNRFGFALLAAIIAYHLHLLESDNYWDYLVDPVYFLVSLVAVIRHFAGSRASARNPGTPHQTPASP